MSIIRLIVKFVRFLTSLLNNTILYIKGFKYGKNFKTRGVLFVRGKPGKIEIGDNVTINSCLRANPLGGDAKTILFSNNNGKIVIGNNVGISNSAIISTDEIVIEDYVFIGGNCKIYDNDFHSLQFDKRINYPDNDIKHAPVRIKTGAFIGAHSIILKGVTIGEKSIIGAGSVVTKDVPDGEIWAGNPARFIRKL